MLETAREVFLIQLNFFRANVAVFGPSLGYPLFQRSYQCKVLQKLTMGGWDNPHHINPWLPEDSVVVRFDVKDAKLCDNVV